MKIGLDRVILKNVDIRQIDTNVIDKNKFVLIRDNGNPKRDLLDIYTGEIVSVNYLKLSKKHQEDLKFNEMSLGRKELHSTIIRGIDYEFLDITLPTVISRTKTNEKNINEVETLLKAIHLIEKELEILGFGEVDLLKTEVKELEINTNIELEHEFKEYERVLNYITSLLPKRMKRGKNAQYKPKEEYTGFSVGNGSVSLKMYNKRKDMLNKTGKDITKKETLRIEYTLKNEQKIRDIFESNKLIDIVNDFEKVAQAFKMMIYDDLIKKMYKDIRKQVNHAKRNIRAYKSVGGMGSVNRYLKNYSTEIIDIAIILEALRSTEVSNSYARESRKAILSAEEITDVNLFGNINKLNEILKHLGHEEIELDITPTIKKELDERNLCNKRK